MVGGGSKRDDGLPAITSTNIFSALGRKKSSKKRLEKEKGVAMSLSVEGQTAPTLWTPTAVSVTSWADCEEDEDDYFAMPPLPPLPGQVHETPRDAGQEDDDDADDDDDDDLSHGEESGEGEEGEEGNKGIEDQQVIRANEPEVSSSVMSTMLAASREPERQLSKKELKKKGLAELDAVLAELGLDPKNEKGTTEVGETKEDANGDINGGLPGHMESKSSKRRKTKREKPLKEGKEEGGHDADGSPKCEPPAVDEAEAPRDKNEVLKKLNSMKKKKSFKDGDAAARAAAAEASIRAAKLAAAKKKEKSHYNQQPVR